ncbi:MAG: hypothetical protein FOGNACKC_03777 [Anaerolineae bacterium]|nr:hypothetical protein [Anaerolineae bacterium]
MNAADAKPQPVRLKIQQLTTRTWQVLINPKTTALLLAVLSGVLLLWFVLPQQTSPTAPAEIWTGTLPPAVQPWGPALYNLGFARLSHSWWLWLPLAGLLLTSLVALAEVAPRSWQRAQNAAADHAWQHPLTRRVEQSVRLPAAPDEHLAALGNQLAGQGFLLHPIGDNRTVSAARRRWLWLAVPAFYGGAILLVAGFILTFATLQTESITLWPFKTADSDLFDSAVELYQFDPAANTGTVIFTPTHADKPPLAMFLTPLRPAIFGQAFIWPTASEPVLTVEARGPDGQLRRLLPVQADLAPDTRLSLPLAPGGAPLYFTIPADRLAFQIGRVSDTEYNVQVRRGSENSPSENLMVSPDGTFELDGLFITLTQNYALKFIARRDFGLPVSVLALLLMLGSGLLLLALPPWQVWLIPEVKGRGGQLFGVVEKIGPGQPAIDFLNEFLAAEEAAQTENSSEAEPPPAKRSNG